MLRQEYKVLSKIIEYLKTLESKGLVFFQRREAIGFAYKKGLPDLYVVYKGRHIEIETKDENGFLSSMQIKYKNIFERVGAIYIEAKCVEDVKNIIERI